MYIYGLVLYNIPNILQPPLDPLRHRQHHVQYCRFWLFLFFRGEVKMTKAAPPSKQLYLSYLSSD